MSFSGTWEVGRGLDTPRKPFEEAGASVEAAGVAVPSLAAFALAERAAAFAATEANTFDDEFCVAVV